MGVSIANFVSSFRLFKPISWGFGLAFLLLFGGKVMEVRNLAQGGDKGDPLHGERLALAQRDLAVTGMMVFLLVLLRLAFRLVVSSVSSEKKLSKSAANNYALKKQAEQLSKFAQSQLDSSSAKEETKSSEAKEDSSKAEEDSSKAKEDSSKAKEESDKAAAKIAELEQLLEQAQ